MRKLLVPLLAVAALAAAGVAAGGSSKTVTISKTGYTPTAVSITTGDAVLFKNTDTVAHTVKLSSTSGVQCTAAVPLVIAASGSGSCTFSSAGKFNFSVTPKAVVYGGKSMLSGKLASGQSGQQVKVQALACGETKSKAVATVMTTTGGAFSYQAQPSKKTAYTLSNKGLTAGAAVAVAPSLQLSKVKRHHYQLHISAAQTFVGKVATFQRYRPNLKRWVKVKRVPLKASAPGTAPTVVTSATFRSGVRAHLRVRVSLGPKQVGSCYLAGLSNTIRS